MRIRVLYWSIAPAFGRGGVRAGPEHACPSPTAVLYLLGAENPEKVVARRDRQAEVSPRGRGGHPPPGGAHQEALPDQERLRHLLDRLPLLTYRDGERRQPDGTPTEPDT